MDHPDNADAARPPSELLDELRLRLLRLDQNHPSRPREPAELDQVTESDEPPEEAPAEPENAGDQHGPDQLAPSAGGHGSGSRGGDSTTWPGPRGSSEPYQPWFMGSDVGVPWFADE